MWFIFTHQKTKVGNEIETLLNKVIIWISLESDQWTDSDQVKQVTLSLSFFSSSLNSSLSLSLSPLSLFNLFHFPLISLFNLFHFPLSLFFSLLPFSFPTISVNFSFVSLFLSLSLSLLGYPFFSRALSLSFVFSLVVTSWKAPPTK